MTFRVGQKVVCVDASEAKINIAGGKWEGTLIKGKIYTIKKTSLTHFADIRQLPCVLIFEIDRPENQPFWAHRFRPVVERKTDISVFTAMLTPAGKKVRA